MHDEVVALVDAGAIDLSEFVTHVIPGLDNFQQGLDLVSSQTGIKVTIDIKG